MLLNVLIERLKRRSGGGVKAGATWLRTSRAAKTKGALRRLSMGR
jgi:hypothetical protein